MECPKGFFEFIQENLDKDTTKLRLNKKSPKGDFDMNFALTQIDCRKKTKTKLPKFLSNPLFLFPDDISAEQSSNQGLSQFHADLLKNAENILDLTAGLGIDSLTMALNGLKITALEIDENKAKILKYNAKVMGIKDFTVCNTESISFLKETKRNFDVIFVDPSRRDKNKNKVYNLHDCSPDIIANQELLLGKANQIIVKASPLLDIKQILRDLKNVSSIKAIGVKGECKEILIQLINDNKREVKDTIFLEAINLDLEGNVISHFDYIKSLNEDLGMGSNKSYHSSGNTPAFANIDDFKEGVFILEPSPMIMKITPWEKIISLFNAKKLGYNSHLFITSQQPNNFPGRMTLFNKFIKNKDRKSLQGLPATSVSKNHPLSSEDIRKKFDLKEGDKKFVYATRINEQPVIFLTSAVQNLYPADKTI